MRKIVVAAGVLLLSVACAGAGTGAQSVTTTAPAAPGTTAGTETEPTPAALTPARFRLNWVLRGYHVPFVLAHEKGFYEEEGIDLEILEGNGSAVAVTLTSTGTVQFGSAEALPTAQGVNQGMPVQMVANYRQSSGYILQWIKGRIPDLESPTDLEGLRVGAHTGSSELALFPALLALNDVDESAVNLVTGPPPTSMYVALLEDRIDVRVGLESSIPEIQRMAPDEEIGVMYWSDFGVDVPGHGIVVNNFFAQQSPDLVEGFVRASARGWEYVLESEENWQEALDIALARYPEVEAQTMIDQFQETVPILASSASCGQPWGWMASEDWETALNLMNDYLELGSRLPSEAFYTNAFISSDLFVPEC